MPKETVRLFLAGMAAGLAVALVALVCTAFWISHAGVRVDVSIDDLAVMVRDQVRDQAESELPKMVSDMEAQVPAMVEQAMLERMGSTTLTLADFTIELPEAATKMIRDRLQAIVEGVLHEILAGFDPATAAAQLGDQAYAMIKEGLADEINGAGLSYRLFGWLPVPVTVNPR